MFIVGNLRGEPRPKVFPFGEPSGIPQSVGNKEGQEVANALKAKQGGPDVEDTYIEIPEATKQGYAVAREGDSINISFANSKTRRGRVGKGVAQTLDTGGEQAVVVKTGIRMLTIIERERLQGFPDGWTEKAAGGGVISETQRKKCVGNAVTVNVIRDIVYRIFS